MIRDRKNDCAPWNRESYVNSLKVPNFDSYYEPATPERSNRYSFLPVKSTSEYLGWPRLIDLCAQAPSNGLMEKRGSALIDIDRGALEHRMRMYYDPLVDWNTLKQLATGLTKDAARYEASKARAKVLAAENFEPSRLRRFALRPFDTRWCYYSPIRPLWNEPRPTLWAQCWEGNSFVLTRFKGARDPEGAPFYNTMLLSEDHCLTPDAVAIPLRLKPESAKRDSKQIAMLGDNSTITANLSPVARAYLSALGISNIDADSDNAALLWMNALAIGYSPAYLGDNADGIRGDWPRVPIPNSKAVLLASAALGKKIAALLDAESPMAGVTVGVIRPELKTIAVAEGPTPLNLSVTAGWGSAGREGVTMPGKGKRVEREPGPGEHVAGLGDTTYDIYLNDDSYWRNIPARVWEYTIGGYQVTKKWLSYREEKLLGRPITQDEAREVSHMARRIAAILLLEPELDMNYAAVKAAAYEWPQVQAPASPIA